jgi:AI-2 transport protein TqsA
MSSPLSAEQSRLTTVSLVILAAAAITAALAYTRAVMVPFVLAIFLAYLLAPLVELLQNRLRVPRPLAVFCALLVAVGLLTLLGVLITTSTKGLLASADIYQDRLTRWAEGGLAFLARLGVDTTGITPSETIQRLPLPSLMRGVAGTVLGLVTSGALVLIFLIYLLSGRRHPGQRSEVSAEIDRSVRRYIVLKVGTSAVTGILVGIILSLFGLDLAIVFGILAFFLNFIPSIGSIIATFLPIPIAVLQFDSLWPIIGVVALPGLVQMGIGNGTVGGGGNAPGRSDDSHPPHCAGPGGDHAPHGQPPGWAASLGSGSDLASGFSHGVATPSSRQRGGRDTWRCSAVPTWRSVRKPRTRK